jgi:hypothetical protein
MYNYFRLIIVYNTDYIGIIIFNTDYIGYIMHNIR